MTGCDYSWGLCRAARCSAVAGDTWFESVLAVVAAQPIVRHIKSTKITSTERIEISRGKGPSNQSTWSSC